MGEFLQIIAGWIETLWPFRIVRQWEQAAFYVFGRYRGTIGPGCYPVVPWFMVVFEVGVVPEMIDTGRQDVTLRDGQMLTFSASAWVRVVDTNLAVNTVEHYDTTVRELLRSVLADKLASVDAERLRPEGRGRLQADLARWADSEACDFGMEVTKVRFTSFVINPKTFRLLGMTAWT